MLSSKKIPPRVSQPKGLGLDLPHLALRGPGLKGPRVLVATQRDILKDGMMFKEEGYVRAPGMAPAPSRHPQMALMGMLLTRLGDCVD